MLCALSKILRNMFDMQTTMVKTFVAWIRKRLKTYWLKHNWKIYWRLGWDFKNDFWTFSFRGASDAPVTNRVNPTTHRWGTYWPKLTLCVYGRERKLKSRIRGKAGDFVHFVDSYLLYWFTIFILYYCHKLMAQEVCAL